MDGVKTVRRGVRPAVPVALALASLLALGPLAAGAATLSGAWKAKIGSGGVNGTATISAFTAGTGTIALKLAKMKPSATVPVVLHKGTCGSVGATLLTLSPIKTTSKGAATRTSTLTASQVTKITTAAAAGKIAIRVGSGTARKCGLFEAQAIPAYVAATIPVGDGPWGVAIAPNGVWVANFGDLTIARIDPATNSVLQTFKVGSQTGTPTAFDHLGPWAVAYGEGSLWVTLYGVRLDVNATPVIQPISGSLVRVDPVTGAVQATVPVGRGPDDVEAGGGAVWVANEMDGSVMRIDPATNLVSATIPAPSPTGVTVGFGATWAACDCGTVSRIDPATNTIVASISTQTTGAGIAAGGGFIWTAHPGHENRADGSLSRIDPATNAVVGNIVVGEWAHSVAYAAGSAWVGLYGAPTVVRVAGPAYTTATSITVTGSVNAIAASDHALWATQGEVDKVSRINY